MSKISEFYYGRTVFITGATGFMGRVLLERMLSTLPDIKRIYILLRPKRNLSPQERIKRLLSEVPFTFNNIPTHQLEKVSFISGDISTGQLNMSSEDTKILISEVSIVIHVAAAVQFNLPLKDALLQNTVATKSVLEFCTQIKNLVSVVHVSTTFCNIDIAHCEEKVYDVNQNVYDLLAAVNVDNLNKNNNSNNNIILDDEIISPHPNTYTYTKRLAEIVARDFGKILPVSIVRPSIVTPAYKKPIEGWVDNLNGPVGIMSSVAMGVTKSCLVNLERKVNLIPVDTVINGIIAACWYRTLQDNSETPVYNLAIPNENAPTWGYVSHTLLSLGRRYPFNKLLSYPRVFLTTNNHIFLILTIFLHIIPSLLLDFFLWVFRQKPFLFKTQLKLYTGIKLIAYFCLNEFAIDTKRTLNLFNELSPVDQETYYGVRHFRFDFRYFKHCLFGTQKYVFKDDGKSNGRYVKLNIFYALDILLSSLVVYWIIKFLYSAFINCY